MGAYPRALMFAAAIACLQGGCGTLVNLAASPPAQTAYAGPPSPSADTCEPFGGVSRSMFMGGYCVTYGLGYYQEAAGRGGLVMGTGLIGAGALVLAAETPLSLIGDVLTMPIVHARQDGAAWATWWGEQREAPAALQESTPPATPIALHDGPARDTPAHLDW